MSQFLLKTFIIIQLFSASVFATETEVKSLSDSIHKQMFVEKKKAQKMSIVIDPLHKKHPYSYQLNLKKFHFHDESTITYDKVVILDSNNQIDIPITFASKPIDIPTQISVECTHRYFQTMPSLEFSLKEKKVQKQFTNGPVCKLISINKKHFYVDTPQNFTFAFIALDKKGNTIFETDKSSFSYPKGSKYAALYSIKVLLKSQTFTPPLAFTINCNEAYAKTISDYPSDKFHLREDISKREHKTSPQIIKDEILESLNYRLIDDKITLCQAETPFSLKNHMNIINDESITLLGDAYIKKLSSSYLEEDFIKRIDLDKKPKTQVAILKNKILAPSEQLLIEVIRKSNRDTQLYPIDKESSLKVIFKDNSLTYQFMKNDKDVTLSEITPFAITFEAVYNADGMALLRDENNCYWGYPHKLTLSIPINPKAKSIEQIISIDGLNAEQTQALLNNYEQVNRVAALMAEINSLSSKMPQENDIIYNESLSALHYLNKEQVNISSIYTQEIAHSDPKGQIAHEYLVKPYMGYYITVCDKIELSDSKFIDTQKWNSSKDYSYNDEDLEFIGVKKNDWGLIAIPVDPTKMPHLYTNYEQYYKFFDKPQNAKPKSVWKTAWSSL
ncbi:hypothetical protein PQO03_05375 [Lentisphaera profundi]|uniref:Uncharacterized protein n=1 Tax=Lentisphaera profundi TaxID=1658616 RepID=A0ABY7VTJ0_9BACT|nr:hypothetical protein [Lentisphaera profundi]WDE97382.1 hypothetical protein PQO03_05375 [Lentisphaera profundi]